MPNTPPNTPDKTSAKVSVKASAKASSEVSSKVSTMAEILADSSALLAVRVVGAAIGVVTSIGIARYVSVETFGLYWFVISCVSLGMLVYTYGLDVVLVRYVARYRVQEQQHNLQALLQWAVHRLRLQASWLLGVIGVCTLLALWLAQYQDWPMAGQLTWPVLLLSVGLLLVLGTNTVVRGFLQGATHRWAYLPEQLLRPALLLLLLLGAVFVGSKPTIEVLLGCALAAAMGALLLSSAWARRLWPAADAAPTSHHTEQSPTGVHWRQGMGALFALAAAQVVLGQTDLVMLGLLRGTEEAGLYGALARIIALLAFGFAAVNAAFAPRISALLATGDHQQLRQISRRLVLFAVVGTLVLVGLFWWLAPVLLGWFGAAYVTADSLLAMRILLLAQLSTAFALSAGSLLVMAGLQRQASVIALMAAGVNLLLNLALVSRFGLVGAAVATAVALCLQNLTAWWFAQRSLLAVAAPPSSG